jgi:hypothetical protein
VRPDVFVGWRAREAVPQADALLVEIFDELLGFSTMRAARGQPTITARREKLDAEG